MTNFIDVSWNNYERFTSLMIVYPKGVNTKPIDNELIKTEVTANIDGVIQKVKLIEIKDGKTFLTKYASTHRKRVQPAPWL